jgi:organic radical activating enzyme
MLNYVPTYLKHQYNLYSREPKTGITNVCQLPDRTVTIDHSGNCFLCICEGWLPISVGHIMEFNSLEDIWQNNLAKTLQKDISDKKFTWCSVDQCGIREGNMLQQQYFVGINVDESCNLQCPSCRIGLIRKDKGPEYEKKVSWTNYIVKLLENFTDPCHVTMSGNGDPLASRVYRSFVLNMKPMKNITFQFKTNGLLMRKLLPKSPILSQITEYSISVDAGERDTYEKVRLGGTWEQLIDNLNWVKETAQRYSASVHLNFCFQNSNYNSVSAFADVCKQYGFDGQIRRVEDWGTFKDFQNENVLNSNHPNYELALIELKKVAAQQHISIYGDAIVLIN